MKYEYSDCNVRKRSEEKRLEYQLLSISAIRNAIKLTKVDSESSRSCTSCTRSTSVSAVCALEAVEAAEACWKASSVALKRGSSSVDAARGSLR